MYILRRVIFIWNQERSDFKPHVSLMLQIFQSFPNVQFYDYTKVYKRAMKYIKGEYPKNYYITYSLNEDNRDLAFDYLTHGGNVAIVFKNKKLPKGYLGFKVINAINFYNF